MVHPHHLQALAGQQLGEGALTAEEVKRVVAGIGGLPGMLEKGREGGRERGRERERRESERSTKHYMYIHRYTHAYTHIYIYIFRYR